MTVRKKPLSMRKTSIALAISMLFSSAPALAQTQVTAKTQVTIDTDVVGPRYGNATILGPTMGNPDAGKYVYDARRNDNFIRVTAHVSAPTVDDGHVYGSKITDAGVIVTGNSARISSNALVDGNLYGAHVLNSSVSDSWVTVEDQAKVTGAVYGAYVDGGNATSNLVTISGRGVVAGRVYGAMAGQGNASFNTVNVLSAESVRFVYGGWTRTGNANNNIVNVSSGGTIDTVVGGWSDRSGSAHSNTVNLSGGTRVNDVRGGISSGISLDNTLNLGNASSAASVGTVANFQMININHAGSTITGSVSPGTTGEVVTINTGNLNSTVEGAISGGNGTLNIGVPGVTTGTLTLTNPTSSHPGPTNVNAGALQISRDSTLGSGERTLNNATLILDSDTTYTRPWILGHANSTIDVRGYNTMNGALSGSGNLNLQGVGSLILGGANTYSGHTTISAHPNLSLIVSGTLGEDGHYFGNIHHDGYRLTFNTSGTQHLYGNITGSGELSKEGTGTLILAGTNELTRRAVINNGTLQIGTLGNTGSITSDILVGSINSTLSFLPGLGHEVVYDGVISGMHGSLVQGGSGSLVLTGTNTFAGTTTINPTATLQIGQGGTTGSIESTIINSGSLIFDRSNNYTFSRNITDGTQGPGSLTKNGGGRLTLTGGNTYTGGTSVNSGILEGSIGPGDLYVAGGAHYNNLNRDITVKGLTGAGTLNITRNMTAGILTVSEGDFSGNITGGGDLFKTGANDLHIGAIQAGNIIVSGGGGLYISQNSSATGTASFAAGTTFGTGGGAILQADSVSISTADPQPPHTTVDINHWDGTLAAIPVITSNNPIIGNFNRATIGGMEIRTAVDIDRFIVVDAAASENTGTAINVTLGNPRLVWNNTPVEESHGTFNVRTAFTLGAILADRTDAGYPNISYGWDGKTLTKTGTGVLTLTGNNTYSGGTEIEQGTLSIGSDANIGGANVNEGENILHPGATLRLTGSDHDYNSNWTLGAGAAIETPRGVSATMAGILSGHSGLTKTGEGRLNLTNAGNDYAGGTTVSAGILEGTPGLSLTGDIVNNAAVVFRGAGTYSGDMSGPGRLEKTGAGELILSGDNTFYTGNTIIHQGDLTFSGARSLGNPSNILHGGTNLTFSLAQDEERNLIARIVGTGSLVQDGHADSRLILSGVNSYANTTLNNGTLSIGSDLNIGRGTNTLNGGVLELTGASYAKDWTLNSPFSSIGIPANVVTTMDGVLSGTGALTKGGGGTLVLNRTNTYQGDTNVFGGTLSIASDNNLGNPTGANNLWRAGTLQLTGTSYARNWRLDLRDGSYPTIETPGDVTMSGILSDLPESGGPGAFAKTGDGTLTLAGANTYTGDTRISAGTLRITGTLGADPYGGSYDGNILNNATLVFDQSANQLLNGNITGDGSLTMTGTGVLILTGNNHGYTGDITVSGGTLAIVGDVNIGTGTNTLAGGTLRLAGFPASYDKEWTLDHMSATELNRIEVLENNVTMSRLTGDGGFIKTGAGTLTLTGTNDYSGATIVGGTGTLAGNIATGTSLFVRSGASYDSSSGNQSIHSLFGQGTVNLAPGSSLSVETGLFDGRFTGTGELIKESAGNLFVGDGNIGNLTVNEGGLYLGASRELDASGTVTFSANTTYGVGFNGPINSLIKATNASISETGTAVDLMSYNEAAPAEPFVVLSSSNAINGNFGKVTLAGEEIHSEITIDRFFTADAVVQKIDDNKKIQVTLGNASLSWNYNHPSTEAHGTFYIRSEFTLAANLLDRSNVINPETDKWGWDGKTLTKTGPGTLIMTGTGHTYGDTIIQAGTLSIASDANIGRGTNMLEGGILQLTGTSYAKGWTFNETYNAIDIPDGLTATMGGNLTGDGGFEKVGEGTLILAGAVNDYKGTTIIGQGTLNVRGMLGSSSGNTWTFDSDIVNNTTLVFSQTGEQVLAGRISGFGELVKEADGTLILAGNIDHTGDTVINRGTLTVTGTMGDGDFDGNIISNGGTLVFSQEDEQILSGSISGTGGLAKEGENTLVLAGNSDYTGTMTINNGILKVTGILGDGDFTGNFVNNDATLLFAQDTYQALSGAISGSGDLIMEGTGTLAITGAASANRYTGQTVVLDGTVKAGDASSRWNLSNRLALNSGATLDATDVNMTSGNLTRLDVYGSDTASANWIGNLNTAGHTTAFHMVAGQFEPVLDVSGTANITVGTVDLSLSGYSAERYQVELLRSTGLTTETDNGTVVVERGTTMAEVFGIWKGVEENGENADSLYAGWEYSRASDKAKAYSAGFLSGLAFVNQGADLAVGRGMAEAVSAADPASGKAGSGFGAISGGKSRYKTGSYSDVSGMSLMAGLSWGKTIEDNRRLTIGGFLEYGNASSDTYHSFARGPVEGDGDMYYYGAGVLGRLDVTGMVGKHDFYAEGSFRVGQVSNKFSAAGFGNNGELSGNYNASSLYLGAHLGTGLILNLNEKNSIDLYGKYFWTWQGSDSVSVTSNESIDFSSINSHRARLGGRFNHDTEMNMRVYAGAAYEYEFAAKAKAEATYTRPFLGDSVNSINAPSLKGSTGVFELGISFLPTENRPLFIDVGLQGYLGKREGLAGSVRLNYAF